jgi:hypothetical protein
MKIASNREFQQEMPLIESSLPAGRVIRKRAHEASAMVHKTLALRQVEAGAFRNVGTSLTF